MVIWYCVSIRKANPDFNDNLTELFRQIVANHVIKRAMERPMKPADNPFCDNKKAIEKKFMPTLRIPGGLAFNSKKKMSDLWLADVVKIK